MDEHERRWRLDAQSAPALHGSDEPVSAFHHFTNSAVGDKSFYVASSAQASTGMRHLFSDYLHCASLATLLEPEMKNRICSARASTRNIEDGRISCRKYAAIRLLSYIRLFADRLRITMSGGFIYQRI